MKRVLSILMAALVLVASMGAAPVQDHSRSRTKVTSKTSKSVHTAYQIGNASWYGKSFHGRTTASGEDFDMFELTAAHRQLPLGSLLKVTNLHNGKWVIVRINDRGPFVRGRIIDVSHSAAESLGLVGRGVAKVKLDVFD